MKVNVRLSVWSDTFDLNYIDVKHPTIKDLMSYVNERDGWKGHIPEDTEAWLRTICIPRALWDRVLVRDGDFFELIRPLRAVEATPCACGFDPHHMVLD